MNSWDEWKKSMGDSRPWHLLDPNRRIKDESVIKNRMDICNSCEYLIKATKQCSKCGCFMVLKTTLANAECPENKWYREDSEL